MSPLKSVPLVFKQEQVRGDVELTESPAAHTGHFSHWPDTPVGIFLVACRHPAEHLVGDLNVEVEVTERGRRQKPKPPSEGPSV